MHPEDRSPEVRVRNVRKEKDFILDDWPVVG